jgi:hypothetical protein
VQKHVASLVKGKTAGAAQEKDNSSDSSDLSDSPAGSNKSSSSSSSSEQLDAAAQATKDIRRGLRAVHCANVVDVVTDGKLENALNAVRSPPLPSQARLPPSPVHNLRILMHLCSVV